MLGIECRRVSYVDKSLAPHINKRLCKSYSNFLTPGCGASSVVFRKPSTLYQCYPIYPWELLLRIRWGFRLTLTAQGLPDDCENWLSSFKQLSSKGHYGDRRCVGVKRNACMMMSWHGNIMESFYNCYPGHDVKQSICRLFDTPWRSCDGHMAQLRWKTYCSDNWIRWRIVHMPPE